MISNKILKNYFESVYKNKFLDIENDERIVRKNLDEIEYDISLMPDVDDHISLLLYPNIPLIHAFMKKWDISPIYEGKKWLILITSDNILMDLDAYDDAFSWIRPCNKSFDYYEKNFGDTDDISKDAYQYQDFYRCPDKTLSEKMCDKLSVSNSEMYLKSIDNMTLINELKLRSLSNNEIKELKKIFD